MSQNDAREIDLIKKKDLAKRLTVSPWTIDDWVRKGKFPPPIYVMPGAPARWRLKDVEAWLAKCRRSRAGKQTPRGLFRPKPSAGPEPQRCLKRLAHAAGRYATGLPLTRSVTPADGRLDFLLGFTDAKAAIRERLDAINAERRMLGLPPVAALTDGGE